MVKILREEFQKLFEKYENGEDVYSEELNEFSNKLIDRIKDGEHICLYRYSSADYYNIRTLETDMLYLSEGGKMNDIFEGLQVSDDIVPNSKELEKISDIARIKCFSEEKESLYMWGHYGDNSSGICIEYDLSLLNPDDKVLKHLFPVIYSENRFKGNFSFDNLIECRSSYPYSDTYDIGELSEIKSLYLVKSKDWEKEREWRILFNIWEIFERAEKDKNIDTYYIHMDCVSAVYMGYRMDEHKKIHIKEIVDRKNQHRDKKHKIVLYDAYIHPKEYKICSKK